MTARDVTGLILRFFSARKSGKFLHILGRFPYKSYTESLWRKFKKIQWRKSREMAGFFPLVVVERVLSFGCGEMVSQESLAPVHPSLAPVQTLFCTSATGFGPHTHTPRHLLHPLWRFRPPVAGNRARDP